MSVIWSRAAWGGLVMSGAMTSALSAQADTVLALACLPQVSQTEAVCAQMRAQIVAAQPGFEVSLVPVEALPEDGFALRLHIEEIDAHGLSAHLEWRAPEGEWQRGESLSLAVMDAPLRAPLIARFLGDLWRRSAIVF